MILYFYRNNVPDFITEFYAYCRKATSIEIKQVTERKTQRPKVNYWLFPVHQHYVTEILSLTFQTSFNSLDRSENQPPCSHQLGNYMRQIIDPYCEFRPCHLWSLTLKKFKTFFTFSASKSHDEVQVSGHKQSNHWFHRPKKWQQHLIHNQHTPNLQNKHPSVHLPFHPHKYIHKTKTSQSYDNKPPESTKSTSESTKMS